MSEDAGRRLAVSVYRTLWRLYPREFRRRFEAAAVDVFEERYREERERAGGPGVLVFLARSCVNVLVHGLGERLSETGEAVRLRESAADLVHALRATRRSARQHVAAVLCVALGVSVASAILTLVSNTHFRPLPFPDADRLVRVWSVEENVELQGRGHLSFSDVADLSASMTTLDPLAVTGRARVMFLGSDGARRVEGEAFGPGYLALLGV